MSSFIGQLSQQLLEQHGSSLGEICVVFPSRRACVFFKDHLAKQLDSPTWAPGVFAIEDFIKEINTKVLLDQVSLTFELYPIYRDVFPDEPFDKFYSWGTMLIGDFEEVDLHLVDAHALFRNMFDLKKIDTEIESWHNEDRMPTDFQARYLRFWDCMSDFYDKLRQKLDQRGMASPAMALREVAGQFQKGDVKLNWEHIVFAGFNALAPAEEAMMKALVDAGRASVYWDLDEYYVDDPRQEAGAFFRGLQDRWKVEEWSWKGRSLLEEAKKITLTGVPQRVGQAKVTGLKLQELLDRGVSAETTAVVLPDENLLFPLLHSLPEGYDKVNVTMGYPLRNTPLYSLVDAIIQLHENADRLRPGSEESSVYYFRDVANILRHPYIRSIISSEGRDLLRTIEQENLVYLSPKYFQSYEEEEPGHLLAFLFQPWSSTGQVVAFFMELYLRLKTAIDQQSQGRGPAVEGEYLYHFYTTTQKLRDKLEQYTSNVDLKIFRRLYKDVLQAGSIPFSGEPLEGLQVMGMLETRVLDFQRIILLSVNEGILPAKPNHSSFIPYSLRKAFGLPVQEDKDAVYAYNFYRLLQRAEEITLVYNTENDTFGSGEKSRFVAQLEAEFRLKNPLAEFREETMTFPLAQEDVVEIQVPKTPELITQLKTYGVDNGFSPSALSTYLNCPLQFYYRNILKLYEKDEPEESMEADTFGKVVHGSLEALYEPFTGMEVQVADIEAFAPRLETVIQEEFEKVTRRENHSYGRNRLLLGVIRNLVEKLLEIDAEHAPFIIRGLELELEANLPTLMMPEGVKIRGYIDRVDEVLNFTRIIDYKTGKVSNVALKGFEEIHEGAKKREPFQLSTYAYLYLRNQEEPGEIGAGIFFLRNLSEGLRLLEVGPTKSNILDFDLLLDFESELVALVDEIYDPEIPFIQTDEKDRCTYCAYKTMCVRE